MHFYYLVQSHNFLYWLCPSLQAAITKYHRLLGLKTKTYFFTVLETRSPRLNKVSIGLVSDKDSPLGLSAATFLLCAHITFPRYVQAERVKNSLMSLERVLSPLDQGHMTSSNSNYFSKAPPPNTITLELGLQHMNVGKANIQSMIPILLIILRIF